MTQTQSNVDNAGIFEQLWGITLELRQKLEARFELHPNSSTQDLQSYCAQTGEAHGSVNTFSGSEITWLVHSWVRDPQLGFCHMHFNVWLGAQIRVPHFTLAFATIPQLFFYMDYLPRSDLFVDLDYVDRYYEPFNQTFLNLHSDSSFQRYTCKNAYMRLALSPSSLCYLCPPTEEKITYARTLAHEMLNRWLSWVDEAEPVPEEERAALSYRDLFIRRAAAERDPDNKIAVRLFGEELTDKLVRSLWGG
jgi:Red chlorophyll catabolite reductase (RCC reductase)